MRPRDHARRLLIRFPPKTLPIAPQNVLAELGYAIRFAELEEPALLVAASRLIMVKAGMGDERVRWYLAHELAHLVLPGHLDPLDKRTGVMLEREANEFAAEFLLPWDLLEREFASVRGLEEDLWLGKLATVFGVTPNVMKIRLSASRKDEFKRAVQLWRG